MKFAKKDYWLFGHDYILSIGHYAKDYIRMESILVVAFLLIDLFIRVWDWCNATTGIIVLFVIYFSMKLENMKR